MGLDAIRVVRSIVYLDEPVCRLNENGDNADVIVNNNDFH